MADDMKVRLGADASQFEKVMDKADKTLDKTSKSLEDFAKDATVAGAALSKMTAPANSASAALAKTAISASKLDSSLGRGAKSSGAALGAITDFNRVIQDAPFGIIGISNNITQLGESFGRLKASTGSTGGAVKALLGSLTGAGGIGLALSLITTAATFASVGFGAWTRGLKDNKAAIDAAKSSYDSVISSLTQEQVKIDKIVVALENETLTRKQRITAIEQLQKAAPAYFATLDKENATIGQITAAYNRFSQSIIKSIEARVREKELLTITEEILKLQDKATKLGSDEVLINGKLVKVARQRVDANSSSLTTQEAYNATLRGTLSLTSEENKRLQELEKTRARLLGLIVGAEGADPFITIDKTSTEKQKKDIKSIRDVIVELSKEIDFLNAKEVAFGTDEAKAKISAIEGAAEKLIKDFKVAPDDAIINKLFFGGKVFNPIKGINIPGIKSLQEKLLEPLKTLKDQPPVDIAIPVRPEIVIEPIDEAKFRKQLRAIGIFEGLEALGLEMQTVMGNAFGNAITNAISGMNAGAIFGNFFKNILSALGEGIQQLGVQTLIVQKLIDSLRKSFGTELGIGASLGLIVLGGVIKGLANKIKIPGFADGVTNFMGGLAMVGERGPELVRLPSGSSVTPNHSLAAIGGGQSMNISGNFRVAGTDLVLVLERANRSLNRVG